MSEVGAFERLVLADERMLFAVLLIGFTLVAAGFWHRSFRGAPRHKSAILKH